MKFSKLSAVFGSAVLSALMLGSMSAGAVSEEDENVMASVAVEDSNAYGTDDELLLGYLKSKLTLKEGIAASHLGKDNLSSSEYVVYQELLEKTKEIADGLQTSTVIQTSNDIVWTYSELGISTSSQAYDAIRAKMTRMYTYLLNDGSYNMYWHDKTQGVGFTMNYSADDSAKTVTYYAPRFSFTPAKDYAGSDKDTVNPTKTKAAKAAADNTAIIISENAGKSDYKKLEAYKDKICELVDYDFVNVSQAPINVGINTWQLIHVFDNNPDTKVVCEGYSKAFHYLYELSDFNGKVECCTVIGTMDGGTGAGDHMWNNVEIGGKNYIVDVTNCDDGAAGAPDQLFLKGMTGSVETGYVRTVSSGYSKINITFKYDASYIEYYGKEMLTLSAEDYKEETVVSKPEVTATSSDGKVVLSWKAVPGATKYAVASYSNGTYTPLTLNCTDTSYTITGLTAGKTYQFLVQAYVNGQWSPYTTADHVSVTVSGPSSTEPSSTKPSNVKAVGGTNSATITWDAVPGATKYAIAYYSNGAYTTLTLNCTTTSYTATGLTAGKTYQFLVQAYVNGQWSPFTTADHVSVTVLGTTKPSSTKPSNVKAVGGTNSATLTWDAVDGATKYAIAYYSNGAYTTLTLNCTGTSYTATGLTAGKTYQFLVQAYVNGQWSPFTTADHVSVTVLGTTKPSSTKPSNVKAVGGTNSATLTWDAVDGATKYAIAYYSNGAYTTLTLNCTTTSYTATGLTAGKTYQFLVQAYVNGQWSPFTTADHVSVTVLGTGSSTKPSNVKAVGGTNSATLTWDAVAGATKYAIAYYTNGNYVTLTLNCTGTSYTATGLTAGKTYQFLVQAYVDGKWSPYTTADHVSVTVLGTGSSTKPSNVKAVGGTNSATLTWDAVAGATKYAIAYYTNGNYVTLTLNCTGTSYTATGLTAGKTYQFLVQAYVDGKWSPYTTADHVSVTVLGTGSSTKPSNVKAVGGTNSATLTWDAVAGATKYAIAYYTNGNYVTLTLDCTDTSYTATGLTSGKTYQFLVQAYVNGKWSPYTTADHVSVTVY